MFVQSKEATHNLTSLPPPLEGEDTEMPGLPVELTRHTMLDGDLDMSFDLGEAVARAHAVVKIKNHIPILPDFLSLVRDAVFILRLSHDKWVSALFPSMNVSTSFVYFAAGTNHAP